MKKAVVALGGLMVAGAAEAHEAGLHVHPHGSEGWMALAFGLVVMAGLVAWRQK